LPTLFSARRIAVLTRDGLNAGAVKLVLKAEAHVAAGHASDEDALLKQAVDLEPRLSAPNLTLAEHAEAAGDFPGAADRYRRILAIDPNNVVALNNLAFNLAEKQHDPKDALPFAQRAYQLSGEPVVADTLGWVDHLLGDNAAAARLLEAAAAPGDVGEILMHAAVVHEALNDRERARRELAAALKVDETLKSRADVIALIGRLKGPDNSHSAG
jgi:tetratricopeptide (TPR) repeat protein